MVYWELPGYRGRESVLGGPVPGWIKKLGAEE
jgi:hypothetical protein